MHTYSSFLFLLALLSIVHALPSSIEELHALLFAAGPSTCENVISSYLQHLEAFDLIINAIGHLSLETLEQARQLDHAIAAGNVTSTNHPPLFCVPVLLKANFACSSCLLPNTAASVFMQDCYPSIDSDVTTSLLQAGAIILGTANLHEFALEGITRSSLYGQTLNPWDHTRTPGGSSGGSGAALGAGMALLATGTDTMNSLRSPASANNIVSLRPTRGLISRFGVVPVCESQDVVGPMARRVDDLARMLDAMVTTKPAAVKDSAMNEVSLAVREALKPGYYTSWVDRPVTLKGLRLGVIDRFLPQEDEADPEGVLVLMVMARVFEQLRAQGVVLELIEDPIYHAPTLLETLDVQKFEFRDGLEEYLADSRLAGGARCPRSYDEIFSACLEGRAASEADPFLLESQHDYIKAAARSSLQRNVTEYKRRRTGVADLQRHLLKTLETVDYLIYPHQRTLVAKTGSPSQKFRNGILASLTGFPAIALPAGFATDEDGIRVPVGMEILGRKHSEGELLWVGKQIEALRLASIYDAV